MTYLISYLESLNDLYPTKRVGLLAAVVTGTEELKENIYNQKGDKIDMCKAVDNALKERESLGRQEGLLQGLQQGLQQGRDKATVNSIQNLTKNLGINISEAMKLLGISEQDQERYLMLL